ncbi:MAG: copper resistance protein B [Longimicrobiales bacterium]
MAATIRTLDRSRRGITPWLAALLVALAVAMLPEAAAAQVMDDHIYWMVMADELEYAPGPEGRPVFLGASVWVGGDYNRLRVKLEGEGSTLESEGDLEAQALYSRLISPFFEAHVGLGMETTFGGAESLRRGLFVLGLQGLAPYWFEIEPQLLVSHEGDVSFAFSASYALLFSQRLVLEPELELKAALQEVPEWEVGSGLNDVELGGRLRYEIAREFAPYVGVVWERRFGQTADFARAAGADVSETRFVAGVHVWY